MNIKKATIDLNLKIRAGAQYSDSFEFTSMVKFGDKFIGTKDTGLFEIGGDSDDGVNIDAYFIPLKTDFGLANPKRMRFGYFGFKSASDLSLEVSTDDESPRSYTVSARLSGQQGGRKSIGRNGKGRYWSYKIGNTNGADFSFDSLKVLPVILSMGRNG